MNMMGMGIYGLGIGWKHIWTGIHNICMTNYYRFSGSVKVGRNGSNFMNHILAEMITRMKKLEDEAKMLKHGE